MLHFTRFLILGISGVFLAAAACSDRSDSAPPGEEHPLRIVCTTGMIADAARAIAGEHARVVALMGSGVDPHLYQPTRSDMARLTEADLVLYNGLHLEGKMIEALERAAASGRRVHAVGEAIDPGLLLSPAEFPGGHDPHVWMSPTLWSRVIEAARDRMIEADPDHAEQYSQNAQQYLAQVASLEAYARRVLGTIPESARVLVTAHDAFHYFGREFGMEVVGIQGISTESEAGVYDIERIVSMLVDRKIGAVFIETTVAERNVRALIAGAQARGHRVNVGGLLYSDAMGAEGTYEGTYLGMLDHNVTIIARALGGQAPPGGMNDQLNAAAHP